VITGIFKTAQVFTTHNEVYDTIVIGHKIIHIIIIASNRNNRVYKRPPLVIIPGYNFYTITSDAEFSGHITNLFREHVNGFQKVAKRTFIYTDDINNNMSCVKTDGVHANSVQTNALTSKARRLEQRVALISPSIASRM